MAFVFLFVPFQTLQSAENFETAGFSLGIESVSELSGVPVYLPDSGHGGKVGIELGTILASPIMQLSKNVAHVEGFFTGIQTTYVISRTEEEEIKYIGNEVLLLREVYTALTFDIIKYLNTTVDRHKALDEHIAYLIDLAKREQNKMALNAKKLDLLRKREQSNIRQINEIEKIYFDLFESYHAKRAEDVFLKFIDISEENVKVKALTGAFTQIDEKHQLFYPLLLKRIQAIKANREALLQGIRVIDIEEAIRSIPRDYLSPLCLRRLPSWSLPRRRLGSP